MKLLLSLLKESGQGLMEYFLIISIVILGAILAIETVGDGVEVLYERIRDEVVTALS